MCQIWDIIILKISLFSWSSNLPGHLVFPFTNSHLEFPFANSNINSLSSLFIVAFLLEVLPRPFHRLPYIFWWSNMNEPGICCYGFSNSFIGFTRLFPWMLQATWVKPMPDSHFASSVASTCSRAEWSITDGQSFALRHTDKLTRGRWGYHFLPSFSQVWKRQRMEEGKSTMLKNDLHLN